VLFQHSSCHIRNTYFVMHWSM